MNLTPIGKLLRPHGLKGEIKALIDDGYEEDLLEAGSFLAGSPPIPLFIESARGGGALILKLDGLDTREAIQPIAQSTIYLPADRVSAPPIAIGAEVQNEFTPLIGYTITAEGYPKLGPIEEVLDLPQHYLAQLEYEGRDVLIPLHEDLIFSRDDGKKEIIMNLPEGLLD